MPVSSSTMTAVTRGIFFSSLAAAAATSSSPVVVPVFQTRSIKSSSMERALWMRLAGSSSQTTKRPSWAIKAANCIFLARERSSIDGNTCTRNPFLRGTSTALGDHARKVLMTLLLTVYEEGESKHIFSSRCRTGQIMAFFNLNAFVAAGTYHGTRKIEGHAAATKDRIVEIRWTEQKIVLHLPHHDTFVVPDSIADPSRRALLLEEVVDEDFTSDPIHHITSMGRRCQGGTRRCICVGVSSRIRRRCSRRCHALL